jgi:hypothetical protein
MIGRNQPDRASSWIFAPEFPWDMISTLFIAGTTHFKYCGKVRRAIQLAKDHGKWIHMGRVNSVKRLNYARSIGCHSCDGSGMARFRNRVLVPMLRALDQPLLPLPHF